MMRFAFCGRVPAGDNQDPEVSRNWQLQRVRALVDQHGPVVEEHFDVGQSRSIPWKRRPEAARLLTAMKVARWYLINAGRSLAPESLDVVPPAS